MPKTPAQKRRRPLHAYAVHAGVGQPQAPLRGKTVSVNSLVAGFTFPGAQVAACYHAAPVGRPRPPRGPRFMVRNATCTMLKVILGRQVVTKLPEPQGQMAAEDARR